MIKLLIAFAFVFASTSLVFSQTHVDGYYRSNGTYVQPHYRSSPDSSTYNNWSTRGNTNPYTGARGTKSPRSNSAPLVGTGTSALSKRNCIFGC